jgi:tetratricopeptide (TPR) repeat protein
MVSGQTQTLRFIGSVAAVAILLLLPAGARAQQLALQRDVPPLAWAGCPATALADVVAETDRAEAARLAAEATQAALLGDDAAAQRLLALAVARDPASPDLAFRLALAFEQLDRPGDAVREYCRYVALDPTAVDAAEVLDRIPQLHAARGLTVAAPAADAFVRGIAAYDAGRFAEAETAFGAAWNADREWGAPLFNRAVTRLAEARVAPALDDLRRYLELSPRAPDFQQVLDLVVALSDVPDPARPGRVLASGLLIPGLGQFTTGRWTAGGVVFGSAAVALAVGIGVRRVEVACATPVENGSCPADQVLHRRATRPYQTAGVATAVAIGVLGALDAYRGAQRSSAAADIDARVSRERGASIAPPAAVPTSTGVRLDLIRLRF